jgi:hypothetical protein
MVAWDNTRRGDNPAAANAVERQEGRSGHTL